MSRRPRAAAIPAPASRGTQIEVSRGGVIIMDSGRKLAIGSPYLIPKPSCTGSVTCVNV